MVIVICISMFVAPIYTAQFHCKGAEIIQNVTLINNRAEYSLGTGSGYGSINHMPVIYGTLNYVILGLTIIAIGLYRKRKTQRALSRYLLVLSIVYTGLIFFTIMIGTIDPFCPSKGHIEYGAFLTIMPPILFILAGMAISKDMENMKYADRLR